jgi:small subunit ribosomal protein S29
MIRSLFRSLSTSGAVSGAGAGSGAASLRNPFSLSSSRAYAAKGKGGSKVSAPIKGKARAKDTRGTTADEDPSAEFSSSIDLLNANFEIPTSPLPVTYDKELDVGPGGRPLFSFTKTFSSFSHGDPCTYVDFRFLSLTYH